MTYVVTKNRLNRDIDRLFNDFFTFPSFQNGGVVPAVDIQESPDNVKLTLEIPGMEKDDIKISVKDDVLTVSGERKFERSEESDSWVRREIRSGAFSRSFTLPDTVNVDDISAEYKNGMLTLKLGKKEEARPKEIEVKVS